MHCWLPQACNLLALVELPLTYLVAAFYKFAQLDNLESLRQKLLKNAEIGGLQGTLLLAAEGINATLCGSEIGIKDFIDLLRKEEAFNELYNECSNLVYRIAFSILKNKENSEDIKQMVFL